MAPPLAGSMNMRPQQFLSLDFVGAALYVTAYTTLGYLFRDFVASITHSLQAAAHYVEMALVVVLLVYVAYRLWIYRKHARLGVVPRVPVEEVARRMNSEEGTDMIIADVRSHGYYNADSARIRGSIRLEPNNLSVELEKLPRDKDIFLYCT